MTSPPRGLDLRVEGGTGRVQNASGATVRLVQPNPDQTYHVVADGVIKINIEKAGAPGFLVKTGRVPSFAGSVRAQTTRQGLFASAKTTRSKLPGITETLPHINCKFMTYLISRGYPPRSMKR